MMRKNIAYFLAAILTLAGTVTGYAQKESVQPYFELGQLPKLINIMPAPPAFDSPEFANDIVRYGWGKQQRQDSARVAMAIADAEWDDMTRLFGLWKDAFGLEISPTGTPEIYKLLVNSLATTDPMRKETKAFYHRQRPFERFDDTMPSHEEDELRGEGSYPSGHSLRGWGISLLLAQIAPEHADAIYRRGWDYCNSRVIVGAHWQSDVDAGRLAASAAVARMHTSQEYLEDLADARAEYIRIKGVNTKQTAVGFPHIERIIDAPGDTASYRHYGDVAYYWLAKAERTTPRGAEAVTDTACTVNYFLQTYGTCTNIPIDITSTPDISAMVTYLFDKLCDACSQAKSQTFRKRPFLRMGEHSALPEKDQKYSTSSSYPSSHSIIGWGIALALVEVMPDCQDAILQRGYEYGRSRTILGFHFKSDVQAGRLVAAYTLASLHNDAEFRKLLAAAQKEYANSINLE